MGQIAQWDMKIGQYNVEFIPRRAIKSQTLTYFIIEWTDSGLRGIDDLPDQGAELASCSSHPEGDMLKYVIQIEFPATNNTAEYEGLVTGLRLAKELGIRQLLI
jgi:hypothetical protein